MSRHTLNKHSKGLEMSANNEYHAGLSDMLQAYPWQYFFTGTFRNDWGRAQAIKSTRRYFQGLERRVKSPDQGLRWFFMVEGWTGSTRPHAHGLIYQNGIPGFSSLSWFDWYRRFGRAQVTVFDPDHTASVTEYVTKYILKDASSMESWDIGFKGDHAKRLNILSTTDIQVPGSNESGVGQ